MAHADVGAIAAAAGIARGTFYFHFPSKEDVLLELTRREEVLIGAEMHTASEEYVDLEAVLTEMIRRVVAAEGRLGATLFRDVLSFYFSTTQPGAVDPANHPLTEVVADHIKRARGRGDVYPDVDPMSSATFFLLGLYALLATNRRPKQARAAMLKKYVRSVMHGLVRY
jgi:AcrR family transcriptional regulator